MSETESVTEWLQQLKAGESDAGGRLWQQYVERLVRLARRKLAGTGRRVADEEDLVLSVFDAFLQAVKQDRFQQLDDRDDLWQVLVMLTERQAIGHRRWEGAAKRGGGQVRGESVFAAQDGNGSRHGGLDRVAGHEPTPAFATEMTEQLARLLDRLDDPLLRRIATGKLEGFTNGELARRLDISLRAVERKLQLIRRKWDQEVPE